MKDPIKIIHKFKNNKNSIQYKVYIFIGSLVPEPIMKILNSFIDKDFYTMLSTIKEKEYEELMKIYGEFWYEKFYISYHINNQLKLIHNNNIQRKTIETKYGKEWYNKHIKEPPTKKVSYSFASAYYNYLLMRNKIKTQTRKVEMDFRTYNIASSPAIVKSEVLLGGEHPVHVVEQTSENLIKLPDDEEEEEKMISNEDFQEQVEEDFNLEELSKIYTTADVEKDVVIAETSKLISNAINDKQWEKSAEKVERKQDDSLEYLSYDTEIHDVYKKYYVTEQYIFKDDTIKTMRQKICIGIHLAAKFGNGMHILPETQYFWSEYEFESKPDLIMLGQKWIRRNELLKIDIKPNENIKVYEKLRNNLSYLKESFGYKIKREDDETNIVRFYENFITMNEIFMLDIYNELGVNYNPDPEAKRNMYDVYINIYFPMLSFERLEQIINLLNGKNDKELQFIESQFRTIRNDIKLESYIENTVEKAKQDMGNFNELFNDNYIIQSIIHVNINDPKNITGTISNNKFDLYRIFDNFVVNKKYPFIQYQTADSQLTYKFYTQTEKVENQEVLAKWFENAPYGISFKLAINSPNNKTTDKFLSINLHETGRIEYKITWKEQDQATVVDINETYNYVRDLLKKINSENKKIKFILPQDDRFKYAFINTILKFTIPDKFKIDHNDLSEFSRFFFPYVSLEIEPKKRQSKKNLDTVESSKYGTYLRYKRISKYENRTKMHLRILYFLRNYELSDRELIDEIAKQFNITLEYSAKEIDFVKSKYQKVIKRASKTLKKLKTMPHSKKPGIGIDIQGRDRDRYKIRITGARNKDQLDEIIDFIKVVIYLYVETYLYKKKDFQKLKDTLQTLTNIAKRRFKVLDYIEHDTSVQTVRSITSLDKSRLGFKPEKGQNQWTRSCQNSGNDKKRRPDITPETQIEKLIKDGYKLNSKTGYYEKEINMKIKGENIKSVIKAIKLSGDDNTVNFFSCDPTQNQEHMYIGFLARGNNPNDLCMPCCFKKDHMISANKAKKNYYLKCLGEQTKDEKITDASSKMGDKLYILQDTNKIQDGRFIKLQKYLDIFFNKIWGHDQKIKKHYLLESKSGYFFKYTVKHDYYYFLNALSNIYDKPIEFLINRLIEVIKADVDNKYFSYLNNGDICESFKTRDNFIEYLQTSNYLEYDMIGELIELPGVITPRGINFYIFNKQTIILSKSLEKTKIRERFYLDCLNNENYSQFEQDRDIIILIKEDKYYFPIYRVQKDETITKKISLEKVFSNSGPMKNIITELKNYHLKSCTKSIINQITINTELAAKNIINKLIKLKIAIKKQYIDDRQKCIYIELDNGLFLPTSPSGISYDYPFNNIRTIKSKWLNLNETIKSLNSVEKVIGLNYIPKTVFYDTKINDKIKIISIMLVNGLTISILNETINEIDIKKLALSTRFQPLDETINQEIINYDNKIIYDDRAVDVKQHNYINESYNLYRLELSLYLSDNSDIREKIISIVRNELLSLRDKKHELRKILLTIIDKKLLTQYKLEEANIDKLQYGGRVAPEYKDKIKKKKDSKIKDKKSKSKSKDKDAYSKERNEESMVVLIKELPNLETYKMANVRDYCKIHNVQDKCNNNHHCLWQNDKCKLQLLDNSAIDFINKIIEEMIQDGIKFKEIIQEYDYYVSDIVNNTQYTNRDNQKIIKASNFNITKLMSELFGKDKIPIIGRRQILKSNIEIIEDEYPELIELGKQFIQQIVPNKDSIIRAYVNSYYWINNPLYDIESRNLKYISDLQTSLTYLFKANIIDFIQNNLTKDNENIKLFLKKYFKNENNFFESTLNKFRKTSFNTDGQVELFILSHLIDKPIVVYDNYSVVKYIFLQGHVPITPETIKNFTTDKNINNTIFLKFDFDSSNTIPKNIYSIYYI